MHSKEQLASIQNQGTGPGSKRFHPGSLLLLLAFLLGFAAVVFLVFGDKLKPRIPVVATPALLIESEAPDGPATAGVGAMLAQASGWVEPDPFELRVPVKTDGFVESVLVYEGDTVRRGQLLATLDPTNHTLRVQQMTADLREAEALVEVSRQDIEQALQQQAAAQADTAASEAVHHEAQDRLKRIQTLNPGDLSETEVVAAERASAETRSKLEEARANLARAEAAVASQRAQRARQEARADALQAALSQAEVDLERTKIHAPGDGVVLKRYAAPGMKRRAAMDDPDSATIVSLYDPQRLQVRVDVPLSDAGRMVTGMPAKVMTAALAGQVLPGRISRITGQADITRNTLQVKVALTNPPPALRPEMLCRVEFFAAAKGRSTAGGLVRGVWLPEQALEQVANESSSVWVVDPVNQTVSARVLELGAARRDGHRAVAGGLRPGELVVIQSEGRLESGARVSVTQEKSPESFPPSTPSTP